MSLVIDLTEVMNHKLLSINFINIMKNFENIDCPYDVSLSLHPKIYIFLIPYISIFLMDVTEVYFIFVQKQKIWQMSVVLGYRAKA